MTRRPADTAPHTPDQALADRVCEVVRLFGAKRVAAAAGVSQETIRRITCLGQAPNVRLVSGLCNNLGVSGDWLLLGHGPRMAAQVTRAALREASPAELLSAVAEQCSDKSEELDILERAAASLTPASTSPGELEAIRLHLSRVALALRLLADVTRPQHHPDVIIPTKLPRLVPALPDPPRHAHG